MPKWWRTQKEEPRCESPPEPPPPAQSPVVLPDAREARQALSESIESKRRTDELVTEVKEMLKFIKAGREENNFAPAIVELIKRGR